MKIEIVNQKMEIWSMHYFSIVFGCTAAGYGGGIWAVARDGMHKTGSPYYYFAIAAFFFAAPLLNAYLNKIRKMRTTVKAEPQEVIPTNAR